MITSWKTRLVIALLVTAMVVPAFTYAAEQVNAYQRLRVARLIVTNYIQNSEGRVMIKDLLTVTGNALFKNDVTMQDNLAVGGTIGVMNVDFADADITALDTTTLTGGSVYYNLADTKLYMWTGTAWVDLSQTSTLGDTIESSEVTDDTIAAADIATDGVATAEILDGTVASADIATDTIAAADIATDGVATAEILDGTVASADIATDTIVAADIATDGVATTEILDGTVAAADIATDGVATAEILDGTVASADIAVDTIVAADIATDAVTTTEILDGTVAAADIATDGVATAEILDGTVASADIATDTIAAADIATDGVATAEILDGTVAAADIANVGRYISFSLGSFIECDTNTGATIGFDATADRLPDFDIDDTDGTGAVIRFDDTSGTEDQDTEICNNFTVPADYATSASFRVRIKKDAHTAGAAEKLDCAVSVNGAALQAGDSLTISAAASTNYTCTPTVASLATDDSVSFYLSITTGTAIDDVVDIASVAFVYNATQ